MVKKQIGEVINWLNLLMPIQIIIDLSRSLTQTFIDLMGEHWDEIP